MKYLVIRFTDNDFSDSIRRSLLSLRAEFDPRSDMKNVIHELHEENLLHDLLLDLFVAQHSLLHAITKVRMGKYRINFDDSNTKSYLSKYEYSLEPGPEYFDEPPYRNGEWVWMNLDTGKTGIL
jgi:hypothetical protein